MYTTATLQHHVQTLLDPSVVHAIILILEMEKHATIQCQVNTSHVAILLCFKMNLIILIEIQRDSPW